MSMTRRELFRRAALPAVMAVAALASPDVVSHVRQDMSFGFGGLRFIDSSAWGTLPPSAISGVEPLVQLWTRRWGRPVGITYFREFVRLEYPNALRVEITYSTPSHTMAGYVT